MKAFIISLILIYLKVLARIALFIHRPYVIGVAGSAGKSSACNAIYAALRDNVSVKQILGNSETGIPLGLVGLKPHGYTVFDWLKALVQAPLGLGYLRGVKYAVVEMGIDDPLPPKNMVYLLSIIRPDCAVSLNISATHTMQFEKIVPDHITGEKDKHEYILQAIAQEDTKIITKSGAQAAIYNGDDRLIQDAVKSGLDSIPAVFTFGEGSRNTISYTSYQAGSSGTRFEFRFNNDDNKEDVEVVFPEHILPAVYKDTFSASLLVAHALKIPMRKAVDSLQKHFTLPPGRSSLFEGINESIIIDSSYNSSRQALLSFLELVENIKKAEKRPVVFVCGDMNELGDEAKIEHESIVPEIERTADYVYCVGPLTLEFIIPIIDRSHLEDVRWFESAIAAGDYLKENIPKNSLVLVKGSQNRVFLEEALKKILRDPRDKRKLCRQESYWMKFKRDYFNSIERSET